MKLATHDDQRDADDDGTREKSVLINIRTGKRVQSLLFFT